MTSKLQNGSGGITPHLSKVTPESEVVELGGLCPKIGGEIHQKACHPVELGHPREAVQT